MESLRAGLRRRLTVVCAPAGYGKTVAVAEVMRRYRLRSVWHKLDVLDHDAAAFLASLTERIRRRDPGFGGSLLDEISSADVDISPVRLAAHFVAECADRRATACHIVLDDYHEAAESASLNVALGYVIANAPPHMRFVVLTRYEPGFALEKLRLAGEVATIGTDLLRFDERRAADVLASWSGRRHDPDHVRRLLTSTEGWPASIVLAGMALGWLEAPSLERALADPRLRQDVFSYLAEQVFSRESSPVRRFLTRTCCLDVIIPAVADRIVGDGTAHRRLRHLARKGAFTFTAGEQGAYRYHNLFREYLRQRVVQDEGESAFLQLQQDTAAALEAGGDSQHAVELLLLANRPSAALSVIARAGERGLEACRSETLRSWAARIRPVSETDHPWARILSGQLHLREGRLPAALADLDRAIDALSQSDDRAGLYQALSVKECVQFWQGDAQGAIATCRRALRSAQTDAQRVHSLLSLASAAVDMRRWDTADAAFERAEALGFGADPSETTRACALKAHALYNRGEFRRALIEIERRGCSGQSHALRPAVLNTRAMIDAALGDERSAWDHLVSAREANEAYGHPLSSCMIEDTHAVLLAWRGEEAQALEKLARLTSLLAGMNEPTTLCMCLTHRGTILRRTGRARESLPSYRQALDIVSPQRDPLAWLNCAANLAYTEALLEAEPSHDLTAIRYEAEAARLHFVSYKTRLYESVLRLLEGDDSALEALERCLLRQLEYGHIHFIAHELCPRPDLAALVLRRHRHNRLGRPFLEALSCHRGFPAMAGELRARCPSEIGRWLAQIEAQRRPGAGAFKGDKAGRERAGSTGFTPAPRPARRPSEHNDAHPLARLTPRETEILELMAAGHTNAQIASDLFLAGSTVKTHVNRVFRKLGVTTRVQAILAYQAGSRAEDD